MVIILGLGFTGARLANRLVRRGIEVFAAVRGVDRFRELADSGVHLAELSETMLLPRNSIVAHLIAPLKEPENAALRDTILKLNPRRVIYVSSTGVYGDQIDVDSETPPEPNDDRGRARLEEEHWIAGGPWTSLILRSAAIYGPGRGIHATLRQRKPPRSAGSGVVSRIHVEDLAAIIEAGLFADVQGSWPVADEAPCSSTELAQWCAELLGLDAEGGLESANNLPSPVKTANGRRVNGGAIRGILGVELIYPSWRTGVLASLSEENATYRSGGHGVA